MGRFRLGGGYPRARPDPSNCRRAFFIMSKAVAAIRRRNTLPAMPLAIQKPAGQSDNPTYRRLQRFFVLTKGMSAHARTASALMPRPPRRVGAGKAIFGLGPTLQLAVEAGCGDGAVPGRGAPLPIGAIRHLLDKMRSAGFAACSLPSNIGGNRS